MAVGYTSSSNAGDFVIAKYGPDPALGWPRWNELPAVAMNEDEPLELTHDWLAGYVVDNDNAAADLTFRVGHGAHVAVDSIEGGFRLTPAENWFGADTLTLSVTDPDSHQVEAELSINVSSVNDLPLPFA